MNKYLSGYDQAFHWLSRDVLSNLEMIVAFLHEPLDRLLVAGDDEVVRGVLIERPHPTGEGNVVQIDARDRSAVLELQEALQQTVNARYLLHRPWVAAMLGAWQPLTPTGDALLGYARSTPSEHAPLGRRLELRDAALVDASRCGWTGVTLHQMLRHRRQPWAVVVDGRVVCRASTGYGSPWTEEVLSVWTSPAHRNHGLAQGLVATLCNDILTRKQWATYITNAINVASQRVATGVGLSPIFNAVEYVRG